MDAAGLRRAALLGWSEGGPIALAFATDADSEIPRFLGCRLDPPPHYRIPAELREPILFEEPEVHWVAMMVDSGHEDTEAFRAAILESLRAHLDDGEHITEMWEKVEHMNDAEAVRLMAQVGRLRLGFRHTDP